MLAELLPSYHPVPVQQLVIDYTLDTYSHVAPGLQEAAAKHFDEVLSCRTDGKAIRTDDIVSI